jgi:fagellar hook-basal body proteins
MGLNTFSTALSGLDSSTMGLNVVGNNLANLNTVGFKESDISFSEVLGQQFSTPGGNMNSIGLGSQVQAVRAQFSQGGVQTSNNPLDVAIQGSGMLVSMTMAHACIHAPVTCIWIRTAILFPVAVQMSRDTSWIPQQA